MSAGHRPNARHNQVRTRRLPATGRLAGGAAGLLLLAGLLHALASTLWAAPGSIGRPIAVRAARAIDPRLIVRGRTIRQSATAGALRMALTVRPVLPGPNHFALRLVERGRPVVRARVHLVARMTEMAMRPVTLSMTAGRRGRYTAWAPLAMFGHWQLTIQIDRPGAAPLTRRFTVEVQLPAGLVPAQGTPGASHQ